MVADAPRREYAMAPQRGAAGIDSLILRDCATVVFIIPRRRSIVRRLLLS
jgi:hypothetical protein